MQTKKNHNFSLTFNGKSFQVNYKKSSHNGKGFVVKQMGSGMFIQIVQVACNTCNGVGKITTAACYACGGQGTKNEIKTIEIQLPHGIDDGQFLRLQGLGDYRNGGYGNLTLLA